MTFCTNNTKSSKFANPFTKLDVGTTTGHVSRNGNSTTLTSIHDDLGFFIVVFGIQDFVRNTSCDQFFRNVVTGFNCNCTNQDRLTFLVTSLNVFNNGLKLSFNASKKQIWMVNTLNRTVCWDWNNTNVVNFTEFFFLSLTCTRHTRQFLVHTEKVLVSD